MESVLDGVSWILMTAGFSHNQPRPKRCMAD